MIPASIVIPTRARLSYLEVALQSIAAQAAQAGAEMLVVDDAGSSERARALAERFGARYEPHDAPLGLNVARNTGVERSSGELVAFVDDDVRASPGWLAALLAAAREHGDVDVFTGPIRPSLEGHRWRSCGREGPPITSLDLGPQDTDARYAWGANMAIRRTALQRVGRFDESLKDGGDEQEWQDRSRAASGGPRTILPLLLIAAVLQRLVESTHALKRRSPDRHVRAPRVARIGVLRAEIKRRYRRPLAPARAPAMTLQARAVRSREDVHVAVLARGCNCLLYTSDAADDAD